MVVFRVVVDASSRVRGTHSVRVVVFVLLVRRLAIQRGELRTTQKADFSASAFHADVCSARADRAARALVRLLSLQMRDLQRIFGGENAGSGELQLGIELV